MQDATLFFQQSGYSYLERLQTRFISVMCECFMKEEKLDMLIDRGNLEHGLNEIGVYHVIIKCGI